MAGHRLDRRPADQPGSLFGDVTPADGGVGLVAGGRQPGARAQLPGAGEPGDVADLALGFLKVVNRATATDAVTWRLRTPLGAGGGVPSRCPGPVAHDLFTPRGRGVGPAAAAMYAVLQEGPATTAQVAARVGRCPTVCARSLAKLHDAGVATHDAASGTWALVPGHSLDEAVEGRPCAGTLVRRRIRHDLDRRAWTIWRAAHPRPGPGNAGPPRTTSTFAPRSQRGGPAPPGSATAA